MLRGARVTGTGLCLGSGVVLSALAVSRNRRGAFGWLAKSPAQVSLLFFVSAAVCLPEGDEGMPPTSAEKLAQAFVIFWLRSHFQ